MKAAVNYEPGGPEVLRYEDVPDPVPGDGDVLVRVEAISIEGGDTLGRGDADTGGTAHIVGYQAAGTVIGVGAAVTGLPPLLVHVGDAEMLLDDSVRLHERAVAAGVDATLQVWDDMIHVFQAFPADLLPESDESIAGIAAFLDDRLG